VLSTTNITALYSKEGYTSDNHIFSKAEPSMTHTQAQEYCLAAKMDMFEPTADMKLVDLMRYFKVTDIWTPLYTHKTAGILVNSDANVPVTTTVYSTLDLPAAALVADLASKGIKVTINAANQTSYVVASKSESHAAVCMSLLQYPFRTADRLLLADIKKVHLADIYEMKRQQGKVKRRVNRKLAGIPKLGTIKEFKKDMAKMN
jgi:hypothetical protein